MTDDKALIEIRALVHGCGVECCGVDTPGDELHSPECNALTAAILAYGDARYEQGKKDALTPVEIMRPQIQLDEEDHDD